MLVLKKLLEDKGITISTFVAAFKKQHGDNLTKSSFIYFLNKGRAIKRITDFKTKLTKTYNKIANDNKITKELLENIQEDKMIETHHLNFDILKHFNLKKDPFLPFVTKESEIVMLDSHYYALEMMRAARDTGQFTVVTGEVGAGKTTILGKFIAETKNLNDYIIVQARTKDMDRCTAKDILTACVLDLSIDERPKRGIENLTRQVENLLKKHNEAGKRIILILDEAQDLHTHTLKYLKRLWELRDGLTPLIGIVLIGQIELANRLYSSNNLAVREVTARTIHAPLSAINKDIKTYIDSKLKNVKGNINDIITDDAIEELSSRLTIKDSNNKVINKAYPLDLQNRIKRLMCLAYEQGYNVINKEFIDEVGI